MTFPLEYHKTVRPSILPSLALFGMLSLPLLFVSPSPAQINNATSSSAHPSSGTVSVTSTGHSSSAPANSGTSSAKTPHSTNGAAPNNGQPQRSSTNVQFYLPYLYAVPFPYSTDVVDNGASDDNDPDYQGGPTVFDRRGQGPYSYIPPGFESGSESGSETPESNRGAAQAEDAPTAEYNPNPGPPPEPTVLVFKDGHRLEIQNYAVVDQTLYDLTPGHPRKVALADLDLSATEKQNDDHGVIFQLPSVQAN
jgi:hypothetical protein